MQFRVLGGVAATVDGRPLPFARRRERCLLGLLLLEAGRVVPVDRLVDLLWADGPPAQARRTLHSHVARVRAVLSRAESDASLVTRGAGYLLDVDPGTVDAHRFRALVTEATAADDLQKRADLIRDALDLWRGPPLGDDASDALRERVGADLNGLRLTALEQRLAALIDLRQYDDALPQLAQLTVEHPTRERFVELEMTALYCAGRKAEALASYERTRSWLVEHLGLDPTPTLQQLHGAILRDEVVTAASDPDEYEPTRGSDVPPRSVPAELPGDVAGFVGRTEDLTTLQSWLSPDNSNAMVVAAVTGTAGAGKTALAVHFGHRVADRFPDGQLYLNLRGYSPGAPMSPAEALTRLLGSLGVPAELIPAEEEAAAGLYRSRLAGRRVFVLLDNAASAEQVRALLPADPGCLVIVTSRDRLAGLVASHGARRLAIDTLDPADARELLVEILGEDRVAAEAEAAAEVVRLCAFLPLALRVAAANLSSRPHWTIGEYVAALRADRLAMLEVDGDAAIEAAFSLSYARLAPEAQRMFRLLGLAPGHDVTAEAATVLAEIDVPRAARLLDQLAGAHLIEEHRPRRYTFHDLLRLHARSQADLEYDAPSRRAVTERLGEWYLSTVAAAAELAYPHILRLPATKQWAAQSAVTFADDVDAAAWLDAEHANLVATVLHAAEDPPSHVAWLIADALRGYFIVRFQHLADWLVTAGTALRAATSAGDFAGQAAARLSLGNSCERRSLLSQAIENYEFALESARRAEWEDGTAAAHNNISCVHLDRGDARDASPHLLEALETFRRIGNSQGEATAMANLGFVYSYLGQLREAEEQILQAIAFRRRTGGATALAHDGLAGVLRFRGELDTALEHVTGSIRLFQRSGNQLGEAVALANLAAIHRDAGRLDHALEHARAARSLAVDDDKAGAGTLNTVGTIHTRLRGYGEAVDAHREALRRARKAELHQAEVHALLGLGAAYLGLGEYDAALSYVDEGLARARQAGYRLQEGDALTLLAEVHSALGNDARRREYAERALAIHLETGYKLGEERALAAATP